MPEATPQATPGPNAAFYRFAAVGAVGGFGAFVFSRLVGAGPFIDQPVYYDLPGELMLGAFAALFGVFLLTASDLTSQKTVIFALACGLFWSPVITTVQSYVSQHADNQTVSTAESATNLAAQSQTQTGAQAQQTVSTATDQINQVLTQLPQVKTARSRTAIVDSTSKFVDSFRTDRADAFSVNALKQVGMASVKAQAPSVSLAAIAKLRQIAASAQDAQVKSAASAAAASVANASPSTAAVVGH